MRHFFQNLRNSNRLPLGWLALALGVLAGTTVAHQPAAAQEAFDIVIYGGTAGGAATAIQARRMGKTVVIIEPGKHLGGLTSGGLGATDIGNKAAIGGISREFYQRVRKHYSDPSNWTREKPEQYRSGRGSEGAQEDTMWTFEPSVAEKILRDWCAEEKIPICYGERLVFKTGVEKKAGRILSIRLESGKTVAGKIFVDASYEGDLLAFAGVSYHVGREANSVYGETLNGVQTKNATHHQFVPGVDPYVKKGDKSSGLLPGVHGDGPGEEGSGDARVQAYNFRMCVTDVPANRVPFTEPAGYDPLRYELLLRNFEAGEKRSPWNPVLMPNRKTDANNNFGFSSDNIGMNYAWPDADYATRDKLYAEHLLYQQGLLWTLASNPRVPEKIRAEFNRWGLCKDEFTDNGGYSHQLYVREARRMISSYVMNQNDCQGRRVCDDSVGLGAYNMDSHNVQRYVDANGHVRNEGDIQVGVSPYAISYKSIVPREEECNNLFAPVCLSASHIAYGSIRMEPVFMVLGQSSATAACLAIDAGVTVQKLDYAQLKERLLADKQVLEWTGPKRTAAQSIDPKKLAGVVRDDSDAKLTGDWSTSASIGPFIGNHYLHDGDASKGALACTWTIPVPKPGRYDVRFAYTANGNRTTNLPITVTSGGETITAKINQKQPPPIDGLFISLGKIQAEKEIIISLSNAGTTGHIIIDGVQVVLVE